MAKSEPNQERPDLEKPNLERKVSFGQRSFYVIYSGLVLLLLGWNLSRPGGPLWTILVIQVLPLLVFLPGLLKRYYRTYSWLCFILLLYFIRGVEGVLMSNATAIHWLFLLLVVALFINSMLCSRWLQRSLYTQQA